MIRSTHRLSHFIKVIFFGWILSLVSTMAMGESPRPEPDHIDFVKLQAKIDSLLPKIRPAVVSIECGGGSGSGVIVSPDGLVLTAAHVVDKAQEITIVYPDGRRFKGRALGSFGPADAAMARIEEGSNHPYVNVATGKGLKIHDTVLALGHPGGFDLQRGPPLRIGHILEINKHFLQMDVALIGGDSGGPSFDLDGNVIGIHSHIAGALHINNDSHIASFHLAWDSMLAGKHDSQHYSQSLDEKEKREHGEAEKRNAKREPHVAEGSQNKPPTESATANESSRLKSLSEQSKANGGALKLSREDLLRLRQELAAKTESLKPSGGSRLADEWSAQWSAPFALMTEYRRSVYPVFVGGRRCALGTAVDKSGFLLTKASEVKGKAVTLEIEPKRFVPAEVIATDESQDLALVRVMNVTLDPIDLSKASNRLRTQLEMGTLCAAIGFAKQPVGFGVVSVATRSLNGSSGAYLGVSIASEDAGSDGNTGVKIESIRPNSPALAAGLQQTDRILRADGREIQRNEDLVKIVQEHVPGDVLRIDIQRSTTQLTLMVTLGDGANLAPMPGSREQAIDGESTTMSKRRWFFAKGIQHDCAISPRDCGGPLIDLEGGVLGINIARAGRIQSYAIPIAEVIAFLKNNGFAVPEGDKE